MVGVLWVDGVTTVLMMKLSLVIHPSIILQRAIIYLPGTYLSMDVWLVEQILCVGKQEHEVKLLRVCVIV